VVNASGCGLMVKEYGHHLRNDPAYADKAARISALARDLSELLLDLVPRLQPRMQDASPARAALYAYHPPCTLQHGQQLRDVVETQLAALGLRLQRAPAEAHLCCGSAGTYALLEPHTAQTLRDRKIGQLQTLQPAAILSANVGCITHLQSGTELPVRHWVELLDECLS